jgi:hypothetical protein
MGAGDELMQGSLSARLHGDMEHGYERAVAQFIVKEALLRATPITQYPSIDWVLYRQEGLGLARGQSRLAAEP